jgi:V-type H+-transporting ATPase proteolipid subunit
MGIDHPKGIIKNIVPIVMAGVLGIYGLIVSVIITQAISTPGGDGSNTYSIYNGYTHVRLLDFS